MNLIGNINAIPFRRFRGGGGVAPFPSIPGMIARYSALGLTNEQMAENPVWKDLTGNRHDLQMKNFLWAGMSGVGGYVTNKEVYEYDLNKYSYVFIPSESKVHDFYVVFELTGYDESFEDGFNLDVRSTTQGLKKRVTYTKNGIYTFQYKDEEGLDNLLLVGYNGNGGERSTFTVKFLPLYPGALVFDEVDDYGVCDNFPILTKEKGYTVVALRQWISMGKGIFGLVSNVKNWFNDGAFVLEYNSNNATNKFVNRPVSFGNVNIEMDLPNNFTYQTSKSYKGVPITTGSFKGTNSLFVGKLNNIIGNYSNVAIWELVFLDHDATEEELTKIKDYFVKTYPWLFPDQAWTVAGKTNEDEDRATIANITGNGNDLVLSNFDFAEGSGYGLYGQNYISYAITNRAVYTKTNSSIHVTKSITAGVNFTESARNVTIPSYRIKVTGIQSGQEMIYRGSNNTFLTNIPSDGIYVLPAVENGSNLGFQFVSYTGDCDITIEQIPEYEGYLVTDGVDDKITSSAFKMGKDFTVVGEWKFLKEDVIKLAGFIKYDAFMFYNYSYYNRINIYIYGPQGVAFNNVDTIKAVTSEGQVYFDFNSIKEVKPGDLADKGYVMNIGHNGSNHTKLALKNFAIYPTVLSKDDCIKAYNYLQTLKAK